MLDFYLHNVELSSDGYRARYTIRDGEGSEVASTTLTDWAPAFVTGLEAGTYEVNLQLIGSDGNVVPGPFNDTTREIDVRPGN
jgi:methionine-rich copper-binding protein CopC